MVVPIGLNGVQKIGFMHKLFSEHNHLYANLNNSTCGGGHVLRNIVIPMQLILGHMETY